MMQAIRDHARGWLAWVIVGLISIPFALWGINEYINPTQKTMVAEVNGEPISRYAYQDAYQRQMMRLRQQFQGQSLDWNLFENQLKQNILDQLVKDELLRQYATQSGMRVGDQQVAAQIHAISPFQENGQFSQVRYETLLRSEGLVPRAFEEDMRRGMLTSQLESGVQASAFMTQYEQYQRKQIDEQQRLVSYLVVPIEKFTPLISVEDAEIEQYFTQHATQYVTDDKVKIAYIELSLEALQQQVEPPNDEVLQQRYERDQSRFSLGARWKARQILLEGQEESPPEQAKEVLAKAQAGEDFAELAKQYSQDTITAKQGGDMGWIDVGTQLKPVEDALTALQPGEISGLIKTQFGWQIVKLEQKEEASTKPFAQVRDELLKEYVAEEADTRFYALHEQFANLAFEQPDNLHVLSETLSLPIQYSDWFTHKGTESGITKNVEITQAAFSEPVLHEKVNSKIIELTDKHLVVLRLQEYEPSKPKTLAEVKEEIKSILTTQKAKQQAQSVGQAIQHALEQGQDWQSITQQHGITWQKPQWVKRLDAKIKPPELLNEAFKLGQPEAEHGLLHGFALPSGDWGLVAVLGIQEPAREESVTLSAGMQSFYQRAISEQEYQAYLADLQQAAEIKTFPNEL